MQDKSHPPDITSLDEAMRVTRNIYNYAQVPPQELQALIREGAVGPNLARARELADAFPKLAAYAREVLAKNNGRTLEQMAATGEALLLILCYDVRIAQPSEKAGATARLLLTPRTKEK